MRGAGHVGNLFTAVVKAMEINSEHSQTASSAVCYEVYSKQKSKIKVE